MGKGSTHLTLIASAKTPWVHEGKLTEQSQDEVAFENQTLNPEDQICSLPWSAMVTYAKVMAQSSGSRMAPL